ncbi:MAG: DNRLRE domain-containing protein [Planctomycetota bacterium]
MSTMFSTIAATAAATMLCLTSTTQAGVGGTIVNLTPSQDGSIYDEFEIKANGAGDWLFAGRTQIGDIRRCLVQFDVSGIPAGATILNAQLVLTFNQTQAPALDVDAHALLEDWTTGASDPPGAEGNGAFALGSDVTWRYRSYNELDPPASPEWAIMGGTFNPAPSATAVAGTVPGTSVTWTSLQVTSDVQAWVDGTSANNGWLLKVNNETTIPSAKRFVSSENPSPTEKPTLVIEYVLGGPPPCPWDCTPDNGDGTFGNGVVNIDDLLEVINSFGAAGGPCDSAPDNGDGTFGNNIVNIDDLLAIINNFGACPS